MNKNDSNNLLNKICILVFITTFPMLHVASIVGRPDIFGFVFILLLILLTIDYKFDERDYKRYIFIIFTTISLLLTRRWYIFFVFSYYFFYLLCLMIISIIEGKDKLINRLINILLLFLPMFSIIISFGYQKITSIIHNNYKLLYSVFSVGGFKYEMMIKLNNIGIVFTIIMIIGFIYSLVNKKNRYFSIILLGTYLLSITLFLDKTFFLYL